MFYFRHARRRKKPCVSAETNTYYAGFRFEDELNSASDAASSCASSSDSGHFTGPRSPLNHSHEETCPIIQESATILNNDNQAWATSRKPSNIASALAMHQNHPAHSAALEHTPSFKLLSCGKQSSKKKKTPAAYHNRAFNLMECGLNTIPGPKPSSKPDNVPSRKYIYEEACTAFNVPLTDVEEEVEQSMKGYRRVVDELSSTIRAITPDITSAARSRALTPEVTSITRSRAMTPEISSIARSRAMTPEITCNTRSLAGSPEIYSVTKSTELRIDEFSDVRHLSSSAPDRNPFLHSNQLQRCQTSTPQHEERLSTNLDKKLREFAKDELGKLDDQISYLLNSNSLTRKKYNCEPLTRKQTKSPIHGFV